MFWNILLFIFRYLPLNSISRFVGFLAGLRVPQPLLKVVISAYVWFFSVDLSEADLPKEGFHRFQDFFRRPLRLGARHFTEGDHIVCSPCDGAWGASGQIQAQQLYQVKGRPYSLAELLNNNQLAEQLEGGQFATLYLSPRDYHRFHSPIDWQILGARTIAGKLWPVNEATIKRVDAVFSQNERIVVWGKTPDGTLLVLVPVGAFNVGKILVDLGQNLESNLKSEGDKDYDLSEQNIIIKKGQEWGSFGFGSTIVLCIANSTWQLEFQPQTMPLRLGEPIAHLHT